MDLSQLLRAIGLPQAYQAYQQNIGQPFANIAGPFGRGLLGLERPEYGEEQAYRTGQAVGNMPAVAAPVGAAKAAAQVPGLLADATQAFRGLDLAGLLGLTAYHGSPYRFSKFDPTKIGSGEGAQAYGYGMYFAENPKVAEGYKYVHGGGIPSIDSVLIDGKQIADLSIPGKFGIGLTPARYKNEFPNASLLESRAASILFAANGNEKKAIEIAARKKDTELIEEVQRLSSKFKIDKLSQPSVSFYTVDIPDEMIGRMLDWDKPFSKQSQDIQNAIRPLLDPIGLAYGFGPLAESAGEHIARLSRSIGHQKFSEQMRSAGIPGIKYLDQASRGAKQGTRNFVVFPGEEEAIKMLKVE